MRVVIQRVSQASVIIGDEVKSAIGKGLLVLAGFEDSDKDEDINWISSKIVNLRVFDDEAGVMNCSLLETGGELLLVSQFTLHAATRKGNRPSYIRASKPAVAIPLYEATIRRLETGLGKPVGTGTFGADMQVTLVNHGPVTIFIDSHNRE
jgi:D-tyrosyl-tRNA(Tyr) deacylase